MFITQALAAVICEPGVKTTEGMLLRDLLQEAAALGRPLFTLFDHPAGEHLFATSQDNLSAVGGHDRKLLQFLATYSAICRPTHCSCIVEGESTGVCMRVQARTGQ